MEIVKIGLKQRNWHICLSWACKKKSNRRKDREGNPSLMLPVHTAKIKSPTSPVNKSMRADRFCWNNSWVTNRKQLVQPICRKIQRPCQRKSCWKRCFHPSQRIVSQAKVLLSLPPFQLTDVTTGQMPWPKRISWPQSNKPAVLWSRGSWKNKQPLSRWMSVGGHKEAPQYCLSSTELPWSLFHLVKPKTCERNKRSFHHLSYFQDCWLPEEVNLFSVCLFSKNSGLQDQFEIRWRAAVTLRCVNPPSTTEIVPPQNEREASCCYTNYFLDKVGNLDALLPQLK